MTNIEWRNIDAGVRSRDKHWVVHPTPNDPFAPYGVYRDSAWIGGAISVEAGKNFAQQTLAEDPAIYVPGDTVVALNYDDELYSFVLSDVMWFDNAGVLIDSVKTEYFEGHGTEFRVHLKDESVAQWLGSGVVFDDVDDYNTITITDTALIGDKQ